MTAWETFTTELTTRMYNSWPEVRRNAAPPGGGIYELSEKARENTFRTAGYPFAVFEWSAVPTGDWGLVNSAFDTRVNFHYVDRYPQPQALHLALARLRNKLDTLRHDLISQGGTLTTATVLDCDGFDWSAADPVNAIFYDKNNPLISGFVTFTFVIGETV